MNAVYKSIWNESLGAWVATAENTAARGKKGSSKKALAMPVVQAVAAAAALAFAAPSWAQSAVTACVGPIASVYTISTGSVVNCDDDAYTSIYVNSPSGSVEVNLTQPNATVTSQYGNAINVDGSTVSSGSTVVNTKAGQKLTVNSGEGGSGISVIGYKVTVNNKADIELKDLEASSAGIRVIGYGGHPTVNNEGAIKTVGDSAAGIRVDTKSYRDAEISLELQQATINHNAGTITTSGENAYGLYIQSEGRDGTYNVNLKGTVNTTGVEGHGVYVYVDGDATGESRSGTANIIVNGGTISATGENSSGIRTWLDVSSAEAGMSNITINGGSVSGGWGTSYDAAGIKVIKGNSEITIAAGASVGALSDLAIDTANIGRGVPEGVSPSSASNTGSTNITNSGTITGTINTSNGNTTINNEASGIWNLRKWSSSAGGARDTVGDIDIVLGKPFEGSGGNNTINNNATGTISMVNGFAGDKITINGNYNAQTGAKVNMDVTLNGDTSASDKLVINGTATGATKVYITNVGGTGGQTVNGISLIEVNAPEDDVRDQGQKITRQSQAATPQDAAAPATFTLGAPVQVGNYEYFLNAKGTGYSLESTYSTTPAPAPTPTPAPSPTPSATPTPTPAPVPAPAPAPKVLRPGVVAYSLASQTNFELDYASQGTYNDRIGVNSNGAANQGWARINATNVDLSGAKAFDIKQKHSFVQAGKDLLKSSADGKNSTSGLAFSYGSTDNTVSNRDRLAGGVDTTTGTLKSTQLTLAAYHTMQQADGSIIDLVGSFSSLDNKYSDVNGTGGKQSGTGFGISAEFSKPFEIMDGSFTIEPQVQLSYKTNSYKAFNDTVATIDAYSADSLRARVGVRLSQNDNKTPSGGQSYAVKPGNFYVTANILQDLITPEGVTIGGTTIQDDVNKKTWLELGVGGQAQLSESTTFYGNLSVQKSITGSSRSAASGNIGLKVSF